MKLYGLKESNREVKGILDSIAATKRKIMKNQAIDLVTKYVAMMAISISITIAIAILIDKYR